MDFTSNMSALDGNAKIEISVSIDADSAVESAIIEKFNESLDEINGEAV